MRILQLFSSIRFIVLLVFSVVPPLILGYLGGMWWMDERYRGLTCMILRPEVTSSEQVRGFIELSLKRQDPVERTVEGNLYLRLEEPPVPPPSVV
jgi:hypothetical protein